MALSEFRGGPALKYVIDFTLGDVIDYSEMLLPGLYFRDPLLKCRLSIALIINPAGGKYL